MKIIHSGANADRVHLLGFRTNVLNIVKSCDVFVLSSLFGESITKSVIEAMSLEVTPVITDIPGNVELVNHGENGLVVRSKNPGDITKAVMQLYNDRELCRKMGVKSREHIAKNLNTEQTVLKTKQMYEDMMAGKKVS
jgi:glycosyltransferase involved in cell wall biosynthesis